MDRDKGFVFVITYGRSGSTLLQGVLNSIPGFVMSGENSDALSHFYRFYMCMKDSRNSYLSNSMPVDSRNSWFSPCSCLNLDRSVRSFLFNIFSGGRADTRVSGFKGIRWGHHIKSSNDDCELSSLLDWMSVVLDARFIFLTRNLDEVVRSGWHARNPVRARESCLKFEEYIKGYLSRSNLDVRGRWFGFHFDTLHDESYINPELFKDLFLWLGEDFDERRIRNVLGVRYGY